MPRINKGESPIKEQWRRWQKRTGSILSYSAYRVQLANNNWDESKVLIKKDPDLEDN